MSYVVMDSKKVSDICEKKMAEVRLLRDEYNKKVLDKYTAKYKSEEWKRHSWFEKHILGKKDYFCGESGVELVQAVMRYAKRDSGIQWYYIGSIKHAVEAHRMHWYPSVYAEADLLKIAKIFNICQLSDTVNISADDWHLINKQFTGW